MINPLAEVQYLISKVPSNESIPELVLPKDILLVQELSVRKALPVPAVNWLFVICEATADSQCEAGPLPPMTFARLSAQRFNSQYVPELVPLYSPPDTDTPEAP